MSTKKDKFSIKDKFYMELALDLARAREGLTGPNPSVGCVIVKNDELISIGQTSFNGRPHAELNAIKNSVTNLKASTMYVTLEPCSHHGNTPPCCDALIAAGINRLVGSMKDPDIRVNGNGFLKLRDAGVDVIEGVEEKSAIDLNKGFDFTLNHFIHDMKKLNVKKN